MIRRIALAALALPMIFAGAAMASEPIVPSEVGQSQVALVETPPRPRPLPPPPPPRPIPKPRPPPPPGPPGGW
jgi:hypothetical protein